MANFVFQFEAVLTARRNQRDVCRQLLAQVFAEDRTLVERLDDLKRQHIGQLSELRELGRSGELDVDRLLSRRYSIGQLFRDILRVEEQRTHVARRIEACRQAVAQADQRVKVLEKLAEKRRAEFHYVQERRESLELESAWLARHVREPTP